MKQSDDLKVIQIAGQTVSNRVVSHIQAASRNTGVDFSYLMAQAGKESAFESEAGSHTSSAKGLFQFTRGTWLQLVKLHGAAHGLGDLASHIHHTARGEYVVHDAKMKQKILDLRRDPQISSLMAGEYARDNKTWLQKALGRPVNSTDLYMAHFLGPGGAARILKARAQDPSQPAAAVVPQAAHNNPSVFYDTNHTPRSVAAVYERIHRAIERPMKQYAKLEPQAEAAAEAPAAHGHHHHGKHGGHGGQHGTQVASQTPDKAWPFETGQWPPAYVPPVPASDPTPATKLAYTDSTQSADQISSPMPPAAGAAAPGIPGPSDMDNPLGKLLKDLFG